MCSRRPGVCCCLEKDKSIALILITFPCSSFRAHSFYVCSCIVKADGNFDCAGMGPYCVFKVVLNFCETNENLSNG